MWSRVVACFKYSDVNHIGCSHIVQYVNNALHILFEHLQNFNSTWQCCPLLSFANRCFPEKLFKGNVVLYPVFEICSDSKALTFDIIPNILRYEL